MVLGWFLSCAPSEIEFDGKEYYIGYKGQNILYKWDVSDAWNSVQSNRKHFENEEYSLGLIKINKYDDISLIIKKEKIQVGDIVYFDHTDNGVFNHAAIVSKIEDGKIYYAAHTTSRDYQDIEKYLNNFEDGHTAPTINILKMREKVIVK